MTMIRPGQKPVWQKAVQEFNDKIAHLRGEYRDKIAAIIERAEGEKLERLRKQIKNL